MSEDVRPFPKAPPRKEGNRGKRKRKSAVYTDTPEKEKIRAEYEAKQVQKVKKKLGSSNPKTNSYKKNKSKEEDRKENSDSEDEECFCLVCLEPYSTSKPGEKWVQCKSWAHEQCTQQNDLSTVSQSNLRQFVNCMRNKNLFYFIFC